MKKYEEDEIYGIYPLTPGMGGSGHFQNANLTP
jgi:hypothetical protein